MAKPQIFNRDMKRLAYLDNALAVGYGLETNSLWTATFTLPADDPKNAYCTPLNFVEIFDGDERIDLFRIIGEDMERKRSDLSSLRSSPTFSFSIINAAAPA